MPFPMATNTRDSLDVLGHYKLKSKGFEFRGDSSFLMFFADFI